MVLCEHCTNYVTADNITGFCIKELLRYPADKAIICTEHVSGAPVSLDEWELAETGIIEKSVD